MRNVEIRPGVTVQLNDADYERWLRQKEHGQGQPQPAVRALIRVEVRPGVTLQLTPEEAQCWREQNAREKAAAALQARVPVAAPKIDVGRCGVVLLRESEAAFARLEALGLPVQVGEPHIAFERTLIWDPAVPLRVDLIPAGFHFLESWQAAAPIHSYEQLARDLGVEADRQRTEAVIRDLRVPAYDPRVLFLRRCPEAEQLLEAWMEEQRLPPIDDPVKEFEASGFDDGQSSPRAWG